MKPARLPLAGAILMGFWCFPVLHSFAQEKQPYEYAWEDPTKIKTADTCRQCHTSAYEVWADTKHATSFKTLHRKKAAEDIADRMGFKLIKRESLCLTCHYTPIIKDGTLRAESGVSCESCHGAAADWLNIHNNYGGKGLTYATETPEHKAMRIEETRRLGMRRPSDLYPVASRCFQCHTVPHEELVDKGGHGTGSADFEFVSWSQGKIRHNFFESFLTGDGTVNAERSPKRKRVMYVLGRALDVEYTVRGIAIAKENKRYFKAMSRRLRTASGEVRAIQSQVRISELDEILSLVRSAKLVPNNETDLMAVAQKIGDASKAFLDAHDGSKLAPLDPLVNGEPIPIPPEPEVTLTTTDQLASDAEAPDGAETSGNPTTTSSGSGQSGGNVVEKIDAIPAVGEKKAHLRPRSQFDTIGPGKCSSCHRHEPQSSWWFDDPHYAAVDPFFAGNPKNLKIAKLYGVSKAELTKGTSICMDCHGTVVTGKVARDVTDGVGCEACHGPAGSYLEPHQEGDPSQGLNRKGYLAAIKMGMTPKENADKRGEICASCHYITDERLLSSGHPSGQKFDYTKGLKTIKHWESPTVSDQVLAASYQKALTSRGPVPEVRLAREAEIIRKRVPAGQDGATKTVGDIIRDPENKKVAKPVVPKPRPVAPEQIVPSVNRQHVEIPPFPEILESMPVEEVLLLLKQRLEWLHKKLKNPAEEKP